MTESDKNPENMPPVIGSFSFDESTDTLSMTSQYAVNSPIVENLCLKINLWLGGNPLADNMEVIGKSKK